MSKNHLTNYTAFMCIMRGLLFYAIRWFFLQKISLLLLLSINLKLIFKIFFVSFFSQALIFVNLPRYHRIFCALNTLLVSLFIPRQSKKFWSIFSLLYSTNNSLSISTRRKWSSFTQLRNDNTIYRWDY